MKVIFFGTPKFSVRLLQHILENGIEVVAVVTKPDKPQGRAQKMHPSAVKEFVLKQAPQIPLFDPEVISTDEFLPKLAAFQADLFLVVAYGEIIKQSLLDMPKLGCINVHTSLLPKYRGAAPIQRAIMNGEVESGVSIMQMVRKMDAGDVIRMEKVEITHNMTFGELEEALIEASLGPLLEVLGEYKKGVVPTHTPQDGALVTFAPKVELEECEIDWKKSAKEVHDLIRGVNPEPGAWCYVTIKQEKKRLRIMRTEILENESGEPGTLLKCDKHGIHVVCGSQAIRLLEVQLEGKRLMTAKEFSCGLSEWPIFG